MKVEVPELRRCCFCIPLRYGLLVCGYIKLVICLLLLIALISTLANRERISTADKVVISCFIVALLVDWILTLLFVVGSHRKTAKLLHVFYVYSIVILCIYGVFYTFSSGSELYAVSKYMEGTPEKPFFMVFIIQMKMFVGFFTFGVQIYLILLTRSEINKLRNSSSYRFANLAAEGQGDVENGNHIQEVQIKPNPEINGASDNQFVGIMNQCKKSDSFSYNKF